MGAQFVEGGLSANDPKRTLAIDHKSFPLGECLSLIVAEVRGEPCPSGQQ